MYCVKLFMFYYYFCIPQYKQISADDMKVFAGW